VGAPPPSTAVRPAGAPAGSVLIVHGLAEHRGRYAHVQERLAAAGYASIAIDLRGHGEAEGFPGIVSSPDDWLDDVAAGLAAARREGGPTFVLAHSMGTLPTVALLAERGAEGVAGLVLSGCPIAPGQAVLDALSDPTAPGIPPDLVSRDPAVVRAYVEDPLVFHDRVPPECTAAVMLVAQRAVAGAGVVRVPTLLIHGSADRIADPSGAREMAEALGAEDVTVRVYEGLFHEALNEPERERVLADVVAFLDAHR
jgi:acylglycerol lipase